MSWLLLQRSIHVLVYHTIADLPAGSPHPDDAICPLDRRIPMIVRGR